MFSGSGMPAKNLTRDASYNRAAAATFAPVTNNGDEQRRT
jgi:hypothetical protein